MLNRTTRLLLLLALIAPVANAQGTRVAAAANRLQLVTMFDSSYNRERRVWIYTPLEYETRGSAAYPLIVAFDGWEYRDTMPLPLILDTLISSKKAPPMIAVLIDNSEGAERIADLGNSARMATFLSKQLMPYVRSHYRVTKDPKRVIVTGSSAGGLASAFVAFEHPNLFGNVLAQSAALWRGAEASNSAPYEWLTAQYRRSKKKDVTFFLDVGGMETRGALGGAAPSILEANRNFRNALKAKGYRVAYYEVPGGQHAPEYWSTRLPAGIVTIVSGWK